MDQAVSIELTWPSYEFLMLRFLRSLFGPQEIRRLIRSRLSIGNYDADGAWCERASVYIMVVDINEAKRAAETTAYSAFGVTHIRIWMPGDELPYNLCYAQAPFPNWDR